MALFDTVWYVNYGNGSSSGYYSVAAWAAGASISAGAVRRQLAAPAVGSERVFVALTAGTTGGSEPSWTVTRGAKTTDNTVTWQEATGIPGLNGDTSNSTVWATVKNQAVTLGQVIYDSVSGSLQICSTAGTAGNGSQPSFSSTAGTTTADNTVTWTSLGLASNFTAWQTPHARLANALASTWGAAGNTFYVSGNHAETQSTTLTAASPGTLAAPCNILCVDSAAAPPTAYATTATLTTTGASQLSIGTAGYAYWRGLTLNCGSGANNAAFFIGAQLQTNIFENCNFNLKTTSGGGLTNNIGMGGINEKYTILINCNITFGSTSQTLGNLNTGSSTAGMTMIGGSIGATGSIPTNLISPGFNRPNYMLLRDVDLSNVTGNLVNQNSWTYGNIEFQNCKLGSGVTPFTGSFIAPYDVSVKMHNCDSAATNYRYYYGNSNGTIQNENTIVRSGGASDGTTQLSWKLASSANASFALPMISEAIAQWNSLTGASHNATIYLTTNTTLTNKDFWIEVEYLSASGSPLGSIVTSKSSVISSSNLTTDSSTWGGSITNKYSVTVPFTPQMAGVVKVRLYLAKPSVTVYVDPLISIV